MTGFIELTRINRKYNSKGYAMTGYTENPIVINVELIDAFYPCEDIDSPPNTSIMFIRNWNNILVKESLSEIQEAIAKAVTDK